jgi:phosphonate transport system substrate-binding protein
VDLESGTDSKPGAVYKVKEGAAEPFNTLTGKEFSLISTTPVLNSPITMNTETVSTEDQKKLEALFTSDAVTKNTKIFLPKDSKETGIFKQKSGNEKFLTVDDAWFNPIRELTQ